MGQNAERRSSVGAVILFISGSFLKCKKLAFLPPRSVAVAAVIVSLGMPDLSFADGKKATERSFFKELPSKVPYKQYREEAGRNERADATGKRETTTYSLSLLGVV